MPGLTPARPAPAGNYTPSPVPGVSELALACPSPLHGRYLPLEVRRARVSDFSICQNDGHTDHCHLRPASGLAGEAGPVWPKLLPRLGLGSRERGEGPVQKAPG